MSQEQCLKTLQGKTAIVTGGSRGIGAAMAKRLAASGAYVAITYVNNADKAEEVVKELNKLGCGGEAVQLDVGDVRKSKAFVADLAGRRNGKLDFVVLNAAIQGEGGVHSVDEAKFDQVVNTNIKGAYFTGQAAVPFMPSGGRIIFIGTMEVVPMPGIDLYAMSKAALTGITKAWANELGPKGITVNILQPGPVDTDMNAATGPMAAMMTPRIPRGQYGTVEEVAEFAYFLCGPNSGFVNGASLSVSGGAFVCG